MADATVLNTVGLCPCGSSPPPASTLEEVMWSRRRCLVRTKPAFGSRAEKCEQIPTMRRGGLSPYDTTA